MMAGMMAQHTAIGSQETTRVRGETVVQELRDPAQVRALLLPRRGYAAYALGQLAPRLFPQVQCWVAENAHGAGLVLYSGGGLGDALFMMGATEAVEAILRLHRGPRQDFVTCEAAHLPVLERYFNVPNHSLMARMVATRESFEHPQLADRHLQVRRLSAADAREVNRLYNTEGTPTYYTATHIGSSAYHGVYHDGRLVSVAGTHVVAPEEGVAVVGNVFTHPRYRGRGYGTLATGATTAALLEHCQDVVLTVDPKNIPAVRAYWRLGYNEICRLVEAPVTRRDWFGLGAALTRTAAAWRGRSRRVEILR